MAIPMLAAALSPVIGTLVDRLIPDKHEAQRTKAEMEVALLEAANAVNLAQAEVNKMEAQHRSIFVAGWRPWIGWVCGAGFAWAFVLQPIAAWATAIWAPGTSLPELDTAPLFEMTLAMLGLGAMRSWEKSRGLTK
jgi:hypothetical protein